MRLLVNIDVPALEPAIAFYREGLGLRLSRRLFDGSVAEMTGADSTLYLLEKAPGSTAGATMPQRRDYARHWTPVHLDFVVEDLDGSLERALAAGAKLEGKVQTFAWGRQAVMSDPFGNGCCLVQWLGKGYDEVSG